MTEKSSLPLGVTQFGLRQKTCDGSLDRRERCPKFVRHRIEKRGAEAFFLASRLGLPQRFDGADTLDGDGDESPQRFQSLTPQNHAGKPKAPHRPHPHPHRHIAHLPVRFDYRLRHAP